MKSVCRCLAAVVLSGLLFAAGCGLYPIHSTDSDFLSSGIPAARYQVGGGFEIDFTAPADGTVYVVDQASKRILAMESLEEGDSFSFNFFNAGEEYSALGLVPSAKISLYFVPVLTQPDGQ